MLIEKGKNVAIFLGTVVLPGLVVGSLFVTSNPVMKQLKADGINIVLDNSNTPTLDNDGNGTQVDDKNITWEYHNASENPNGHITLNDQSYFGISSNTAWGITGITSVTANFTGHELWLLTSYDGIDWHEQEILTSGQASEHANKWRYIRFYNYENSVAINSAHINYTCSGVNSSDDIDSARVENVYRTSSNLTYVRETLDVSPLGNSREAIKFTKTSGGSEMTILFNKTYSIMDIHDKKVEFDLKGNVAYEKKIHLVLNNDSVGAEISSVKHSAYHCTNITGNWYHIEVPVSCLASVISGYDSSDSPEKMRNSTINGIKINAGGVVIDNLRIGSNHSPLGLSNGTYNFNKGSVYWMKVGWVGKLYSCVITLDDPTIAEQVPTTDSHLLHASPFYIKGLAKGQVVATATLVVGYDRRVLTIQSTIEVK